MLRGFFSRKTAGATTIPLDACAFSVVDVETTGPLPRARDRIIEIAIVRLDANGHTVDEFVTLVNPERDIGPTHIHGIVARDVLDAPRFPEIAGDVATRLAGNVFVAHNARFDLGFVEAEFARIGYPLPSVPALCTMTLAQNLVGALPSFSLAALCGHFNVHREQAHSALEDARATACLLSIFLEEARRKRWRTLLDLGCAGQPPPPTAWPQLPPGGRIHARRHAALQVEPSYLARLVDRLPAVGMPTSPETLEYVDLLNRALEDRRVTQEEADLLLEVAGRWGLSGDDVRNVHYNYLKALIEVALQDSVITEAERRDLREVAQLLGYDAAYLETLIAAVERGLAEGHIRASPGLKQAASLAGLSVCFTGESRCMLDGALISRARAEQLATEAGLIVKKSVTRDLDILVVADPHSLSGKARKAREYGIRIMAESVFWRSIGIDIQ